LTPVVVDVNVFVSAVVGGNDSFRSWPSPPPVRGNLAANVVGILNDAREFQLHLSEHILANVFRVLTAGYEWGSHEAEEYVSLLIEISHASGGSVVEPETRVYDSEDYEDNRILECAVQADAMLIVSDDDDLLQLNPWRGTPILNSKDFVTRVDVMRRRR
jgi:predicted nucleic acid-binding protein